jgi:hypothetical protein
VIPSNDKLDDGLIIFVEFIDPVPDNTDSVWAVPYANLLPEPHSEYNGFKWKNNKGKQFVDHNTRAAIHAVFVIPVTSFALFIYCVFSLGHKGPCTYLVQRSADEHSSTCLYSVADYFLFSFLHNADRSGRAV